MPEEVLRLGVDPQGAVRGFQRFEAGAAGASASAGGLATAVGGLTAAFAALGAAQGVRASIRAAIDWENAMAGVAKTVDATTAELDALGAGLREMSETIPVSANELAGVAEAAGQLGIETRNIEDFTRTMADLGVATNLSAEEAATSLARLANVMQTPQDQFDRLGSTIVDLGNNLATTEREIAEFATRMAGAGSIAGLTEANVLAIGGAMSSVGVEAEAGGTAVQKALIEMNTAVAEGSEQLEDFAGVAGFSAEQFAALWRDDAGLAFTEFVEGLGALGDDAAGTLEDLGLNNQRLVRAFLSLGNAGDLLRRSLNLGNEAWEENTALTEEAERFYETLGNQLQVVSNRATNLAADIGERHLAPALRETLKIADDIEGAITSTIEHIIAAARISFNTVTAAARFVITSIADVVAGALRLIGGLNQQLNRIPGVALPTFDEQLDTVMAFSDFVQGEMFGDLEDIGVALNNLDVAVMDIASGLGDDLTSGASDATDSLGGVAAAADEAGEETAGGIENASQALGDFLDRADTLQEGFELEILNTTEANEYAGVLIDINQRLEDGNTTLEERIALQRQINEFWESMGGRGGGGRVVGGGARPVPTDIGPRREGPIDFNPFPNAPWAGGGGTDLRQIDQATRAIASMADASGVLSDEAEGAVRGLSDVIGGLQGLQSGGGILGKITGFAGVFGGAVSIFDSLFGATEENTRAIRENTRRLSESALGQRANLAKMLVEAEDLTGTEAIEREMEELRKVLTGGPRGAEFAQMLETRGIEGLLTGIIEERLAGGTGFEFLFGTGSAIPRDLDIDDIISILSEMERLEDATSDTADALKELTGTFNAAQFGFKYDLARFQARDFDVPGGGSSSPTGGATDTDAPTDDTIEPAPGGADNTYLIQAQIDGRTFMEFLLDESNLAAARGGQTLFRVSPRVT